MKKIIRTNNLQKALEDYDALRGQTVSYVSELPVSPNIRNCVYCKQSSTDIVDERNLTVGDLIKDFAQETSTAGHYLVSETYKITYKGIVVKGIEVMGNDAVMYEDEGFVTALGDVFNMTDKYTFDVTTYVTEMAYFVGDIKSQELHPVVSFGVIAEVNARIDKIIRERDTKIDTVYNTLDTKIDTVYNNLSNEISNLAENFVTDNLVVNVATINSASIGNAQIDNFDVSSIIANGSKGTDGQVLGKVNGNVEWFSPSLDTNNFQVNYITVNNGANVEGNNFTHKGFDVTSMTVISEDEMNNLGWNNIRNSVLYLTEPNGNLYFHGIKFAATYMPKEYIANVNLQNMANNMTTLTKSSLTFTSGAVTNSFVNGGAYVNISEISQLGERMNNSAPIGTKANDGSIVTNANELYIMNAAFMYNNCRNLTDTFICNPSLITGAPDGYDPMKYCTNMSSAFRNCHNFNQPVVIPNNVTTISVTFASCPRLNQPITIPNSVITMDYTFDNCTNFNQPVTIPNSVLSISYLFNNCYKLNQPVVISNSVTNMDYTFHNCYNFNQPVTIPNSVTTMSGTFNNCHNFNQPVTIPNGVTNLYQTFNDCYNFNKPVTISGNVVNMSKTFSGCRGFNQPITIPNSVVDMTHTFNFCYNFNQPITIPNGVTNLYNTFYSCSNFNQPITIPNGVTNLANTFYSCSRFNQPITIPNGVTNMSGTFQSCSNFNQPITIPNGVTNMSNTLSGCYNFNQPITIPNSVIDMYSTFNYCYNFNQPITIPNGVCNMSNTFYSCSNFNQPITIPNMVINLYNTFYSCSNFNQPITIPNMVINLVNTFQSCSNLNQPVTILTKYANMSGMFSYTKFNSIVHISHEIALGNTSNYVYNMLVNGGTGITIPASRILNDA